MKNLKMINEARRIAVELIIQAQENEPQIAADMEKTAREVSAEMVGLENKYKTEESLVRKLILLAEKDKTAQSFERKLRKFARRNNDALRYSFVFSDETYTEGFQRTLEMLKSKGFVIPPHRIWNAWENAGTARDTGYRGINATVISSQNQTFELQFHTAESFRLKTETHRFYQELRDLKTSDERRVEIIKEMSKRAQQIERPKGI